MGTEDVLTWNPLLPEAWQWAAFSLAGALTLAAAVRTRRSWPRWANLCSLGVRAVALLCALVLINRPEWHSRIEKSRVPPLALLVDASQSLRLTDGGQTSRAAAAVAPLRALTEGVAARGWKLHAFDVAAEGDSARPRESDDVRAHSDTASSPVGEGLAGTWQRLEEQLDAGDTLPPGAIFLVSDGCVNRGRPLAEAAVPLAGRNVPLYAIALGHSSELPPDAELGDAAVRRDQGDDGEGNARTAPRVNERLVMEARATLHRPRAVAEGPLSDATVRLQVMGPLGDADPGARTFRQVADLRHRLRHAPAWTPVRLRFTPTKPGLYRLRISVDPMEGEERLANNAAFAEVQVRPARRRVLFVSSKLGHDYRRLRKLFGTWDDPPVEVVADFVKPAPGPGGTPGEWPVQAVLRRWLDESVAASERSGTLIWNEPDPAHLSAAGQARLRAAVEAGEMNLVWIVNEPAEALARRLNGSPLEDTFLYKRLAPSPEALKAAPLPSPVTVPPGAEQHPVLAWTGHAQVSAEKLFASLGPTQAWGGFAEPREDTRVLLKAGAQPLCAVGRAGRARVALLACGESWRWLSALPNEPDRMLGHEVARRLWRELVDWSLGEAERAQAPVRIFLPKRRAALGERLSARIAVLRARLPDGVRVEYLLRPYSAASATPWLPLPLDPFDPGGGVAVDVPEVRSVALGVLDREAEWEARVRAVDAHGVVLAEDVAGLSVLGSPLEEQDLVPDHEALAAAVRAAGGGEVLAPVAEAVEAVLAKLEETRMQPVVSQTERRVAAVNHALLMLLLMAALVVDAWLRRG